MEGDFVGTPAFASPEQVSEDDVPIDGRSDIFSLGVTLWFMLTGQQPFAGRTFEETRACCCALVPSSSCARQRCRSR